MIKNYKITVNGKSYDVTVEDGETTSAVQPVSAEAAKEQAHAAVQQAVQTAASGAVEAPMPGKIVKVLVAEGDSVKAGQLVVILEAMKMENEIFATSDGIVKKIIHEAGSTVSTGDALLVIE